jgi:predicted amidohydrolase YtcJ
MVRLEELLIFNAKAYVGQADGKPTFAEAVLSRGGVISAVGTNADVSAQAFGHARRIDAGGKLLLPGFFDSHLHLWGVGFLESQIDLVGARGIDDIIARGRAFIESRKIPPGTVVIGHGLKESEWDAGERQVITRDDIDKISTRHPIILQRICGHINFCNSAALKSAGIYDSVPQIEGGEAPLGPDGKPNGVLKENAGAFIRKFYPQRSGPDLTRALEAAIKKALSYGITSIASNDVMGSEIDAIVSSYRGIMEGGELKMRVTMQCGIGESEGTLDDYIGRGLKTGDFFIPGRLRMGPLKLFADGSLGGRTALLRAPYADDPTTSGITAIDRAALARLAKKADAAGIQVAVHAIGDGALDNVIAAYEGLPNGGALRHCAVHCQISDEGLLRRMAANKISALVQPVFLVDDLPVLEPRIGRERAASSYAWGSMERLGLTVGYGTDAPISNLNPLLGIHAAVDRGGFMMSEAVSMATAIDNYSVGSARANLIGNVGRIAKDYLADMVLLESDLFSGGEGGKALITVSDGKVYEW